MQLPPLTPATLIKRYKRFLADVRLDDGAEFTAHCANSGSMLGLAEPGMRVWLSRSDDPKRKLAWSLELVEVDGGLVNVNTSRPNHIVAEAIKAGNMPSLVGYASLRPEVKYGANSRIDLLLEDPEKGRAFVEVKSVTLARQPTRAEFPDAVTTRGAKHLVDLAAEVAAGHRGVMVYLVQVPMAVDFAIARDIDPSYGNGYDAARRAGVEILALKCRITPSEIIIDHPIPLAD